MRILSRLLILPFVVGTLCFCFSRLLQITSQIPLTHPWTIALLPLIGWGFSAWTLSLKIPLPKLHDLAFHLKGHKPVNPWGFIGIFCATQLSHLVGASVGRESPATIMGLSLGKLFSEKAIQNLQGFDHEYWSEIFLRVGVAAGFSAVFGVPWAATLFAVSLVPMWKWPVPTFLICLLGSHMAFQWTMLLGTSHSYYPPLSETPLTMISLLFFWCCCILFGLIYFAAKKYLQNISAKFIAAKWQGLIFGSLTLSLLYFFGHQYASMSLPYLHASFTSAVPEEFFIIKSIATLLSTVGGFAGGEVTPLMTIAATMSHSLVNFFELSIGYDWAACLAIVAILSLLLDSPLAMAILGCELFGWQGIGLFILTAYFCHFTGKILWKKILAN